jgi:hypothetical protein
VDLAPISFGRTLAFWHGAETRTFESGGFSILQTGGGFLKESRRLGCASANIG